MRATLFLLRNSCHSSRYNGHLSKIHPFQSIFSSLILKMLSFTLAISWCALQEWICFFHSCGNPVIKSHWPSKSDSLGIPCPSVGAQAGKPDMGLRTITTVAELLWYYCSPVCGSPSWQVWDLTLSWLRPFYHFIVASSLSLDEGYLFWWVPLSSCQWLFKS